VIGAKNVSRTIDEDYFVRIVLNQVKGGANIRHDGDFDNRLQQQKLPLHHYHMTKGLDSPFYGRIAMIEIKYLFHNFQQSPTTPEGWRANARRGDNCLFSKKTADEG
jgi:hypothetical protein